MPRSVPRTNAADCGKFAKIMTARITDTAPDRRISQKNRFSSSEKAKISLKTPAARKLIATSVVSATMPASGLRRTTTPTQIAALAAKEAVNRSYEVSMAEGLLFERRLFHSMFATEDQSEGMAAFQEKREAQFRDK